jgi:ribosomal protein S18 acetylase RimI-like enzyme
MDIVLRRLTADEGFVLDSAVEDVFDGPIDARRVAAYLAEPSHVMMVAMAGERVVGQCAAVVHRHPDKATELYIDEIGVAPEFKRRGIARRLLEGMLAVGKAMGCEEAWVGTENDNHPARGLYEKQGATAETFAMHVIKL